MDSAAHWMGAAPLPHPPKNSKEPAPNSFLRSLKATKYAAPVGGNGGADVEAGAVEGALRCALWCGCRFAAWLVHSKLVARNSTADAIATKEHSSLLITNTNISTPCTSSCQLLPLHHPLPDCCAICCCDYEQGQPVIALKCSHMFHKECITAWLKVDAGM